MTDTRESQPLNHSSTPQWLKPGTAANDRVQLQIILTGRNGLLKDLDQSESRVRNHFGRCWAAELTAVKTVSRWISRNPKFLVNR